MFQTGVIFNGEPGLVDRVLALHAGSRGFDSHRGHMSERFFRSNRPGYPHPVVSEWRSVIAVSLNVGGGVRLIKPAKLCMCTQNTTNTTWTDARRRVCTAMVPYHSGNVVTRTGIHTRQGSFRDNFPYFSL